MSGRVSTRIGLPKLPQLLNRMMRIGPRSSVDDFEAIFLDDGIGEDFFGDALELFLSFVAAPAVEIQDEEFSLTDILYGGVAEAGKSVLNGLSLGIEDGALGHDPDVSFHAGIIAFRRVELGVTPKLKREPSASGCGRPQPEGRDDSLLRLKLREKYNSAEAAFDEEKAASSRRTPQKARDALKRAPAPSPEQARMPVSQRKHDKWCP